jgi:hypothetical protein
MTTYQLKLNGQRKEVAVDDSTPLHRALPLATP